MIKTDNDKNLSLIEVSRAIDALSAADFIRLERLARFRLGGVIGFSWEDLLQESLTQLFEGRRCWPREVHPIKVISNVMRSIASNLYKHEKSGAIDFSATEFESSNDELSPEKAILKASPESIIIARNMLDKVFEYFQKDEEATLVLIAWCDGANRQDAINETGLEEKTYNAARKRIIRGLEKI